jgi:hypothetical protein
MSRGGKIKARREGQICTCEDLVVTHAVGINEEMLVAARDSCSNVIINNVVPSKHIHKPVARGKLNASFFFFWGEVVQVRTSRWDQVAAKVVDPVHGRRTGH